METTSATQAQCWWILFPGMNLILILIQNSAFCWSVPECSRRTLIVLLKMEPISRNHSAMHFKVSYKNNNLRWYHLKRQSNFCWRCPCREPRCHLHLKWSVIENSVHILLTIVSYFTEEINEIALGNIQHAFREHTQSCWWAWRRLTSDSCVTSR